MLLELAVQNVVIVEQARLTPGAGLTVVSGETGAGKSLLLDALEMVCGGRCQAQLVGPWGDAATVTAVVQVGDATAQAAEAACGIPPQDGTYLLRRRLTAGGRSQAWINDTPVTVATLRALAAELIEVHAQHEALRLADPARQLAVLDAFAGLQAQATAYRAAHEHVVATAATLASLDGGERESVRELDYLRFQEREIDALAPVRGEFSALDQRHQLLSSASEWRATAAEAVVQLSEDDRSCERILARFARRLQEAPEPRFQEAARACAAALEQVRDAAAHCSDAGEALQADPGELATVEARLNAYQELFRKHGDGEEALLSAWQALRDRIAELSSVGERRAAAAAELAAARARREELGAALAQARTRAAQTLAKQVHAHLADLGMPKAVLSLRTEAQAEPTALGTMRQELVIATNPGLPAGPLGAIASGGEAARISLALAEALAARDQIPVLVFDEVDSGVGGRLGAIIGGKLASLGRDRTVLAVTHTPQLAAAAHRQYLVTKAISGKQTRTLVREVEGAARLKEISEMLGGGKAALDQARALLQEAAR